MSPPWRTSDRWACPDIARDDACGRTRGKVDVKRESSASCEGKTRLSSSPSRPWSSAQPEIPVQWSVPVWAVLIFGQPMTAVTYPGWSCHRWWLPEQICRTFCIAPKSTSISWGTRRSPFHGQWSLHLFQLICFITKYIIFKLHFLQPSVLQLHYQISLNTSNQKIISYKYLVVLLV